MKRAVLHRERVGKPKPLTIEEQELPPLREGYVRLKVAACGVCRTDLHITSGELPPHRDAVTPGHQIVGVDVATGQRLGVSWMAGVDGTCEFCRAGKENLCDHPSFTGYDVDGGYANFADVIRNFAYEIPNSVDDIRAAPLLCAGVIGFRSLRVAGVEKGERVGLYGYGASAHLVLPVLQHWGCEVFVETRGEKRQQLAREMGARVEKPVKLDRAITFAPSGEVVLSALSALKKGGVLAINAIHLDRFPQFDYDTLLWGERQIRSVANMTRDDARDFLKLAGELKLQPRARVFPLEKANEALESIASDDIAGAAVLVP